MANSGTMLMLDRLHGDRWSSFGEHAGIRLISSLLTPQQMRQVDILEEFDDEFLRGISPDITLAEWEPEATVFEAGTYLDLAFVVVEGEIELSLSSDDGANRPIFSARVDPTLVGAIEPDPSSSGPIPAPAGVEGSVTFLSSLDYDLAQGETMRLGTGEILGEIGALNGWPQSATARTRSQCTLLQIRIPALRKLRKKSKRLKRRLDELYRSRMLRQHLRLTPLLADCSDEVIDRLAERVELTSCQPGEVVTQESGSAEHLILVRSGFLKLSKAVGQEEVVVTYVSKGDTVGEAELLVDGIDAWQVAASAVGFAELVRITKDDLFEIVRAHPGLERQLWEVAVERIKEIGFTKDRPRRSDLIDFTLEKGLAQGNSVLVIDLETCTRCDDCVRGCASTHGGIPRFVREGEVYEGFLVTRSCYHCEDPLCLVGCPTGAIRRANVGKVVEIDPSLCIGCSACAQNCPYDAIVMHELGTTWSENAVPKYLRGEPRELASKCDLCYTSTAGPACVSSCPQGCATRVSGFEEFDRLLEERGRGGDRA